MRTSLVLVLASVAALSLGSMWHDSATGDEGAHIAAGLVRLQYGDLRFFPEQPPLMNVISAIPLAVSGVHMPDVWRKTNHWMAGWVLLYRSGYDADRLLRLARTPTIALFLGLCTMVFWFVRDQTGSGAWALVAALLTGFCPNLMAHGKLAAVDLAVTVFLFAATALFMRLMRQPSIPLAIACGAMAACAVLSKTSGLIVIPWLGALYVGGAVARLPREGRAEARPTLVAAATALLVFYAVYLGLARELSLTLPFREYAAVVDTIRGWYVQGHAHPQFLLGEFSYARAWPHYYLVAFLLKTPVAAQILFIAACVIAVRRRTFALVACVAFVFLVFAISATSNIALGLRYILPVYPFVYAAIGIALAEEARATHAHRKVLAAAVALLVGWHVVANLVAYPSYISYFNEIIGGNRNADRFLIDSNLDWGQDLKRLRIWCDRHKVDFIRIDYFGGGEPAYEFGKRAVRWPAPRPEPLPPGWFAVSRHFYRISFFPKESPVDYDTYLAASHARKVDTIGGSIDVYHVP